MDPILTFAFLVKVLHGGHLALLRGNQGNGRKEPVLQGGVIPFCG